MKVALLADADWLEYEAATLRRMIVGLAGESVRLVPVMPAVDSRRYLPIPADCVTYPRSKYSWWKRWLLHRVRERLAELEIDVIHALEADSAEAALRLGAQLKLPTLCTCWTAAGLQRLTRAQSLGHDQPIVYTLPTEALMERATAALGNAATLELVRPGVLVDEAVIHPPMQDPTQSLCAMVICDGQMDDAMASLLRALSMAKSNLPHMQVFLYTLGNGSRKLWQAVSRLGLLSQVTLVRSGPGVRELVIQADVVLQPQAMGAVRCVLLEAMAAGRPVIAAPDPVLDWLSDPRTACLLSSQKATAWTDLLNRLVAEPQTFRQLGETAHAYVAQHHSASAFNQKWLDLYTRLTAEALPFQSAE